MSKSKRTPVSGDLRLKNKSFDLEESRWAIVQEVWDEAGLIEILRERMQISEVEVRDLIDSYGRPISTV